MGYKVILWDSVDPIKNQAKEFVRVSSQLRSTAIGNKIGKFYEELKAEATIEMNKDKHNVPIAYNTKEERTRASSTNTTKTDYFEDTWKWSENSSGSVWGSIFSFGISSMVKEDSSNHKTFRLHYPSDAFDKKVTRISISKTGEDNWDEKHYTNTAADNNSVTLHSTITYGKQRGGYAWVQYKILIHYSYKVTKGTTEKYFVTVTKYRDNYVPKHPLEFYVKKKMKEKLAAGVASILAK